MRLLTVVVVSLLLLGSSALGAQKPRPRCENCGMYTDVSSTNVHAMLKVGDKEAEHNFVCVGCVNEFMRDKLDGKAELTGLQIIDYPTFGTKSVQWIDGMEAWYLVGTKDLPGSMEPMIAAFATKEAATKAQKKLGGDLKNFEDMWAFVTAPSDDENSPQANAGAVEYVCEMCNYSSDKPGNCPHCGMKLVKKDN